VEVLDQVEETLKQVEELIEKDYAIVNGDLEGINQRFTELYEEYLKLSQGALNDFATGLAELKQGNLFVGGVKLIKSAVVGGWAWWKKERWYKNFTSNLERIHGARLEIVSQKLKDAEAVEKEHVPYIRQRLKEVLRAVGSMPLEEGSSLKERAVQSSEEAILLLLKSYYIEGAAQFVKSVYEDILKARVIAGRVSVMKEGLLRGVSEVKKLVAELDLPQGSPVFEALNRNEIFKES